MTDRKTVSPHDQIQQVIVKLSEYTQHDVTCDLDIWIHKGMLGQTPPECSCGLTDLLGEALGAALLGTSENATAALVMIRGIADQLEAESDPQRLWQGGELKIAAQFLEAALLGTPAQGWQSIETAPKDGTRVMLYGCEHRRHWFGTGYYFKGVPGDGEGWIAHSFYTLPENDSSGVFTPTHWMPLPSPPIAKDGRRTVSDSHAVDLGAADSNPNDSTTSTIATPAQDKA